MLRTTTYYMLWLAMLAVIVSTILYWLDITEKPLIPIIASCFFVPLAIINLIAYHRDHDKKITTATDSEHQYEGETHGSESGGKAQRIHQRITSKLRVFVKIDPNRLEIHMVTLNGWVYYPLRYRGDEGGYSIDLNPTMEVKRAVNAMNEAQPRRIL